MIYLRKNVIRFRGANGRRGSVIVLVVAVLALLAVIGTVYIVSARSECVPHPATNAPAPTPAAVPRKCRRFHSGLAIGPLRSVALPHE